MREVADERALSVARCHTILCSIPVTPCMLLPGMRQLLDIISLVLLHHLLFACPVWHDMQPKHSCLTSASLSLDQEQLHFT